MLSHCSCVWLFVTPCTVAHQAPLSMGFSRQESWNGLPCSPPGDLHNSGIGWVFYISCISRWVLYYQDLWTSTIQTGKPRAFSYGASLASEGKNPPAVQEMQEALVWSLGGGRSPGGKHGNPLQYSCLENPMARWAWQATVHGVTKGWIWLKRLSMHEPSPKLCSPLLLQEIGITS